MKYMGTDKVVRVGDKVVYHGAAGVIVYIIDDDSYCDQFPKGWSSFLDKGLGVYQEGGLVHLDYAEHQEDLEPLEVWRERGEPLVPFALARDHTGRLVEGVQTCLREDGTRLCDTSYRHGVVHGPYRDFWPNGKVACEGQFHEGKREGNWHYYNEDGSWRGIVFFKDDKDIGFQWPEDGRGAE
jgi:hypothetical protein